LRRTAYPGTVIVLLPLAAAALACLLPVIVVRCVCNSRIDYRLRVIVLLFCADTAVQAIAHI
jgi:hypothetical protein